jgi:hypothetical protein
MKAYPTLTPRLSQWRSREMAGIRWGGAAISGTRQRPLIARYAWPGRGTGCWAKPNDYDNVRSSKGRRNKTRSLGLMFALRVNSGTDKQKRPPEGGLDAAIFPLQFCFTKRPKMRFLNW